MSDQVNESPSSQIDRLAAFILEKVPGEPSQSQGAVDTAIRVMENFEKQTRPSEALNLFMGWLTTRKEQSGPFSASLTCSGDAAELIAECCTTQGWEPPREDCSPGSWGEKAKNA
jgi:hypothetical protein